MDYSNWKSELPENFSPESRVWIYQSNRAFTEREIAEIREQLYQFYAQWTSHGRPAKGWGGVFFSQFVVIVADDTMDRLCGTAVDHSLRFIQSFERQYQVSLLDRMLLGFQVNNKIEVLPLNQVPYALEKRFLQEDTLFFNNTVTTKTALETQWMIPLKDSWLGSRFKKYMSAF